MRRRIAALAAVAAISASVFAATPAKAGDAPHLETYAASANAEALCLSVLDADGDVCDGNLDTGPDEGDLFVSVGGSYADLTSAQKANAIGRAILVPLLLEDGDQTAAVDGADKTAGSADPVCEQEVDLPAPLDVTGTDLICATAFAQTQNGISSRGASEDVGIDLGAGSLISGTPLGEIIAQLEEALAPILDAIPEEDLLEVSLECLLFGTNCPADTETEGLLFGTDLLQLSIAGTDSSTDVTNGLITAKSHGSAAAVDLLPLAAADGAPLVHIEVGQSLAQVTRKLDGSKAVATVQPAAATITINNLLDDVLEQILPVGDLLELGLIEVDVSGDDTVITVLPNQGEPVCLLEGTPLESCIYASSGQTGTTEDGTDFATATAVRLELLTGVQGGIVLALSESSAAVAGELATPPAPRPTPDNPRDLPKTGAEIPIGLGLGVTAIAIAGLAMTRRSRVVAR